jgi:copper chaperone CopZ
MSETFTYSVPDVHCDHCRTAIAEDVSAVEGVEHVDVDLDAKTVTIRGTALNDAALRAAIDEAGYAVA